MRIGADLKIILGSASSARRKIFAEMGYEFDVMSADIDEKAIRAEDPKELVLRLAYAKAEALLPRISEPALLITSDQVIFCNGKIREKPESADEAREFLREYAEHPLETVAGIVVTNTEKKIQVHGVDVCRIAFAGIPKEGMEEYIRSGEAFKHAGGFDLADPFFKSCMKEMKGGIESVLGLPKQLTLRLLKEAE